MAMELQHLRYFQKIAQFESVTQAAKDLHVAQSALSRVLRGLENELGVQLFDRVHNHLYLNTNGQILLKYTGRVIDNLKDMRREIADANTLKADDTIVFIVKVASKFLPQIISEFSQQYPNIHFVIVQNTAGMPVERKWDICLDATIKAEEARDAWCVLKEEICLAMPKNHPLAARREIALREVAEETFIGLQKGSSMNEIAASYCAAAGFKPNVVLESDNPATLRGLMHLGIGIAFNPVITWSEVSDDTIALIPIKDMECCRYINVRLRSGTYHAQAVLRFKDFLIQFFHTLQEKHNKSVMKR